MIFLETKIGKRDFAVLYRVENFSPLGDLGSLSEAGEIILNRTELMLPNLLSCREVLKNTY